MGDYDFDLDHDAQLLSDEDSSSLGADDPLGTPTPTRLHSSVSLSEAAFEFLDFIHTQQCSVSRDGRSWRRRGSECGDLLMGVGGDFKLLVHSDQIPKYYRNFFVRHELGFVIDGEGLSAVMGVPAARCRQLIASLSSPPLAKRPQSDEPTARANDDSSFQTLQNFLSRHSSLPRCPLPLPTTTNHHQSPVGSHNSVSPGIPSRDLPTTPRHLLNTPLPIPEQHRPTQHSSPTTPTHAENGVVGNGLQMSMVGELAHRATPTDILRLSPTHEGELFVPEVSVSRSSNGSAGMRRAKRTLSRSEDLDVDMYYRTASEVNGFGGDIHTESSPNGRHIATAAAVENPLIVTTGPESNQSSPRGQLDRVPSNSFSAASRSHVVPVSAHQPARLGVGANLMQQYQQYQSNQQQQQTYQRQQQQQQPGYPQQLDQSQQQLQQTSQAQQHQQYQQLQQQYQQLQQQYHQQQQQDTSHLLRVKLSPTQVSAIGHQFFSLTKEDVGDHFVGLISMHDLASVLSLPFHACIEVVLQERMRVQKTSSDGAQASILDFNQMLLTADDTRHVPLSPEATRLSESGSIYSPAHSPQQIPHTFLTRIPSPMPGSLQNSDSNSPSKQPVEQQGIPVPTAKTRSQVSPSRRSLPLHPAPTNRKKSTDEASNTSSNTTGGMGKSVSAAALRVKQSLARAPSSGPQSQRSASPAKAPANNVARLSLARNSRPQSAGRARPETARANSGKDATPTKVQAAPPSVGRSTTPGRSGARAAHIAARATTPQRTVASASPVGVSPARAASPVKALATTRSSVAAGLARAASTGGPTTPTKAERRQMQSQRIGVLNTNSSAQLSRVNPGNSPRLVFGRAHTDLSIGGDDHLVSSSVEDSVAAASDARLRVWAVAVDWVREQCNSPSWASCDVVVSMRVATQQDPNATSIPQHGGNTGALFAVISSRDIDDSSKSATAIDVDAALSRTDVVDSSTACSLIDGTDISPMRAEWYIILSEVYASRDDVNAVVVAHSTFASVLASAGARVPVFHSSMYDLMGTSGSTIKSPPSNSLRRRLPERSPTNDSTTAPATASSFLVNPEVLALEVGCVGGDAARGGGGIAFALQSNLVALVGGHGQVALGTRGCEHAVSNAQTFERACELFYRSRLLGPNLPQLLS